MLKVYTQAAYKQIHPPYHSTDDRVPALCWGLQNAEPSPHRASIPEDPAWSQAEAAVQTALETQGVPGQPYSPTSWLLIAVHK